MRQNVKSAGIVLAFLLFSVGAVFAQESPITGGYSPVNMYDDPFLKAAEFAVSAQKNKSLKLQSVIKGEVQIVAGQNYKMCLSLMSGGKVQQASAVVYRDLKDKYSLTSWSDGKCGVSENDVAAASPDSIVKDLYDVQNAEKGPFFQNTDRALVDKYFSKDFGDLIWQDAVESDGEVGALDFDPLYNAQDTKITKFVIGKPEYDKSSGFATVLVSFKNFGKAETVKYLLLQDESKAWKISDIQYKNGDMLKGQLTDGLKP